MILEHDDVAEAPVLLQVLDAFAARPQHLLHCSIAHGGQRLVVSRCLDDDLVRADAVHLVEQPLTLPVQRSFYSQHRKLIGDHAQIPAWRVGRTAIPAKGRDLMGRHRLVPLAEGTGWITGDLDRLQPEVVRSLAPFRGDDYPAAGDGIFAQLRQGVVVVWGGVSPPYRLPSVMTLLQMHRHRRRSAAGWPTRRWRRRRTGTAGHAGDDGPRNRRPSPRRDAASSR